MMSVKGKLIFLADATVNVYPDSRTLAEIAVQTAKIAEGLELSQRLLCCHSQLWQQSPKK